MALRRDCVTYTGVLNVPCSFSFDASMGITCRMGSSVTSTLGSWRFKIERSTSHDAPSKYRPSMYAPCSSFPGTSDASACLVTSVYKVDLSSGQPLSRHAVCTSAAVYVSGMCRPLSHITAGSPSSVHRAYCANLRSNQRIQDPSFFSVAAVIFAHAAGSCPLNREVASASRSPDMPISPASAFCRLFSVDRILSTSRLKRASSCSSTTCVGEGTPIFFLMVGMSNALGSLARMSAATELMKSSRETPPPPATTRGCKSTRLLQSSFVAEV